MRSARLTFELMGMWVLRDMDNWPNNIMAKFRIGKVQRGVGECGFLSYGL